MMIKFTDKNTSPDLPEFNQLSSIIYNFKKLRSEFLIYTVSFLKELTKDIP